SPRPFTLRLATPRRRETENRGPPTTGGPGARVEPRCPAGGSGRTDIGTVTVICGCKVRVSSRETFEAAHFLGSTSPRPCRRGPKTEHLRVETLVTGRLPPRSRGRPEPPPPGVPPVRDQEPEAGRAAPRRQERAERSGDTPGRR